MINSTRLAPAIALVIGVGAPITALAVPFQTGDVLTIEDGVPLLDAYGSMINVASGSFFVMDMNSNESIAPTEKTIIDGLAGITIGSASSPGEYDTWMFASNVGEHYSNAVPVTGSTEMGLDFSGWTVFWNGGSIDMGTNAWAPLNCNATNMASHSCTGFTFANGVASIQWSGVYGDPYELWYSATVPTGGFTGTQYAVYLTGVVTEGSVVPVPAAAWLLGSGLLGLVGVARRKAVKT